jgi:hypothetical protein
MKQLQLIDFKGADIYDIRYDDAKQVWVCTGEPRHGTLEDSALHSLMARLGAIVATEHGWK